MRTMNPLTQLETVTALGYAISAHRLNNNLYVKPAGYRAGMIIDGVVVRPNRDIMQELVADPLFVQDSSVIQLAREMREHFKGYFIELLSADDDHSISKSILELISQDTISRNSTGLLCYLPKKFADDTMRNTLSERLSRLVSQHLGSMAKKIELTIEVIDIKFYALYNSYMMTAISGDNIIVFHSKQKFQGTNLKVSGRVKSHSKDKYGNLVTQINYVKQV